MIIDTVWVRDYFTVEVLDVVTLFWRLRKLNDEGAKNNPLSCLAHLGHRCSFYVWISKNLTSFPWKRVCSDFSRYFLEKTTLSLP